MVLTNKQEEGLKIAVARHRAGEKYTVIAGYAGTGKSTLIKLINDLLTADSGKILINGKEIGVESKKVIAYLPERTYLDKSMTVESVIKYFSEFYKDFDCKKANKLLFLFLYYF